MTSNQLTIVGNLTGDPELRFVQSGAAVCNFTVADTPRVFNRETQQWEDSGDTLFLRATVWRETAENVAATLKKGMEVMVVGRLVSRSWEANGEKRTVNELQVDSVGPSLRWLQGEMRRASNSAGPQNQQRPQSQQQRPQGQQQGNTNTPAQEDPWASAPPNDEPPF